MSAPAPIPARPDLGDPGTFVRHDPPALWRHLRAEHPVYWNQPVSGRPGFWAVTRYTDVLTVYRDTARFTSTTGNVLSTLLHDTDSASGRMLAVTDGPRHRAVRALLLRSFSPRLLDSVVARVHERTRVLLATVVGGGPVDFAADIADHIPINTIGDLMDVPEADRAALVEWNDRTLARYAEGDSELEEWLARNEILLYFGDLAARRRAEPGDDVLSSLVLGEVEGGPLSEEEVVLNCYSLILGADESSRMSAIGAVLALADHPGQWRALVGGEVGLDTAVDEVLRWVSPAMHFGRRAVVDVDLDGETIRAGDAVTLWNGAANRDAAEFPDPETFDLSRTPNRHVAFGHGPHYCLGAFLGRAHVGAVLAALRDSVREIRLLGEPRRLWSNFVHGWTSVPVELTAADRPVAVSEHR